MITEKFKISKSGMRMPGTEMDGPRLASVRLSDLLDALRKDASLIVDEDNSEKIISYSPRNEDRTSHVPLNSKIPRAEVKAYILVGDNFKISLEDYATEPVSMNPSRPIGSAIIQESGINCSVKSESYEQARNARHVIENLYSPYADKLKALRPL